MGLRLPLQTVLDFTNTDTGVTSVVAQSFRIPQDTDNIVVKVPVSSINGSGAVCDIYLQTSDDGGTTYYDVASLRTTATKIIPATALWMSAPVIGAGMRSTVFPTVSALGGGNPGSVLSTTGSAAASSLGVNQVSGLPILGIQNRIYLKYSGTIDANNGVQVQVKVNSKSGTL